MTTYRCGKCHKKGHNARTCKKKSKKKVPKKRVVIKKGATKKKTTKKKTTKKRTARKKKIKRKSTRVKKKVATKATWQEEYLRSKICKLCGNTAEHVINNICGPCHREHYGKVRPDSCNRCGGFGLLPECPECGDISSFRNPLNISATKRKGMLKRLQHLAPGRQRKMWDVLPQKRLDELWKEYRDDEGLVAELVNEYGLLQVLNGLTWPLIEKREEAQIIDRGLVKLQVKINNILEQEPFDYPYFNELSVENGNLLGKLIFRHGLPRLLTLLWNEAPWPNLPESQLKVLEKTYRDLIKKFDQKQRVPYNKYSPFLSRDRSGSDKILYGYPRKYSALSWAAAREANESNQRVHLWDQFQGDRTYLGYYAPDYT